MNALPVLRPPSACAPLRQMPPEMWLNAYHWATPLAGEAERDGKISSLTGSDIFLRRKLVLERLNVDAWNLNNNSQAA